LAACSSNGAVSSNGVNDAGTLDASVDATMVADGGPADAAVALGPTPRFQLAGTTPPSFLDVPFPSDAYVSNGVVMNPIPGLENLVPRNSQYIAHALGAMNGFSRVALSLFAIDDTSVPEDGGAVSAIIDPATLPVAETDCASPTSSVFLLDLAPGAYPPFLPCRTEFHDDQPASATTPVIAAGPARGYVLQEDHEYAVVLTSRIKDTKGRALLPSADMQAVASGAASATGAIGTLYTQAYTRAAAILTSSLATDGASIVAIAPYTTMKKTEELFTLRAALEAAPVPTLAWDATTMAPMGATKFAKVAPDGGTLPAGFTASTDAWLGVATQKLPDGTDDPDVNLPVRAHDQLAAVGTAVFSATSYLQVKPNSYDDVAHATFLYDDAGAPVAQTPVKIWVTFGIPTSPMPANGYPTVILQHGLSGSREWIMGLANVFATEGWMVVGIDSVTFGARAPEPSLQVDSANEFGGSYTGPDGFADVENGSTDFFGSLLNVLAIGDQFRQAGFDTAQLVKLLRSQPDLSALATGSGTPPVIDKNNIAYFGDSLGAMEGTIASALEPRVKGWFLNVNGGSIFHELAAHSPNISKSLGEAAAINFGITSERFSWSDPLVALLQQTVEPGDPISYAGYLSFNPQPIAGVTPQPRNIIQTEALWDEVVTDEANEALARAAGWGLAVPNVGSNADLLDAAAPDANPRATPLANINPDDAGNIHDTPVSGATAVVVQCSPCSHGSDAVDSIGEDDYALPYAPPFVPLTTPLTFTEDYRSVQTLAVHLFTDAFAGTVPKVKGFTPPVRTR
jgi:hypothetical protein